MESHAARVEFAGVNGEVVALKCRQVEEGYLLEEGSVYLPGVNPGDVVTATVRSGRLLFAGGYRQGPNRSATFMVASEAEEQVSSQITPLCLSVEPHKGHAHLLCRSEQKEALERILDLRSMHGELEYSWDDIPDGETDVLRLDSLDSLARLFSALTRDDVSSTRSVCGHLHSWHVLAALESPGESPEDEQAPPFSELPAVLSSRIPVDVSAAVLVDDRAVEALGELAESYAEVLDVEVHLTRDDEEHRPAGLWIEAVLGVYTEEGQLETVAFVDAPFDLHGSRLHLDHSAGSGMTMWSTSVRGHDENILCYYLPPTDPGAVTSPLGRALEETHEKLRSALRDHALVYLAQERDHLSALLHAHHVAEEHDEDL